VCSGSTSTGELEGGVGLPKEGENFSPYSSLAIVLGRTYVHSTVRDIVVDAYKDLEDTHPKARFVYGETGFATGGEFKPHKTHRNGLSVDFMVPVSDKTGQSVPLPTNLLNKWGYSLEFDEKGRHEHLVIDFEALGAISSRFTRPRTPMEWKFGE